MKLEPEFVSVVIGAVAAGVAITTLLIVIYQTSLMRRQTDIMSTQTTLATEQTALAKEQTRLSQRQLEIVEKQDELLARRALLAAEITRTKRESDGSVFQLRVRNTGRRGARDVYWHVFFPCSRFRPTETGSSACGSRVDRTLTRPWRTSFSNDGVSYRHYRGKIADPIYPTRSNSLLDFKLLNPKTSVSTRFVGRS